MPVVYELLMEFSNCLNLFYLFDWCQLGINKLLICAFFIAYSSRKLQPS
ncbi:hypothetical protein PPAR_a0246 [Pseudoalteromonas paragorgicola KMM 3548]|nr:hypothetical protein [Pseudoalteromonas distincta KMM 3548]